MWSSDRRRILTGLLTVSLAAGCGFSPAYAPGGVAEKLRGQIAVAEPANRLDFVFATRLEERLGSPATAPMLLRYSIDTQSEGLAISSDQETLRYHLIGRVAYRVIDQASGGELTRGTVDNFTAYSAIGTTVATRASETDAEVRLMVILADQIVAQLLATSGNWLP